MHRHDRLLLSLVVAALAACAAEVQDPGGEEHAGPVNPSAEFALTMPPCGTPLGSFEGTYAYSNGPYTGSGTSCAGFGGPANGLRYQCVELVMRHFIVNWGLRWWGDAKDLLVNAPRGEVDVYYNGDAAHPPVPGDMLVWPVGQWGHVALVTAVRPGSIEVLEQNVAGDGSGRWTVPYWGGSVGARWSGAAIGWAHAKANLPIASKPRSVRGDVDGDGRADLVSVREGSAFVWPGEAGGGFDYARSSFSGTLADALWTGTGHFVVDVADVDGDGRGDLVTAHSNGFAYVYGGSADGTFHDSASSFNGTLRLGVADHLGHEPVAVADVNGDGRADLVTVHSNGNAYVYPGNADRTFGYSVASFAGTFRSAVLKGDGHWALDVADVDGDGRGDLVTVHDQGTAFVFPGQPDGTFGSAVPSFASTLDLAFADGVGHEIVGVADVTGDGRADLVSAHTSGTAFVWPGRSDGRFGGGVASFNGTLKSSTFGGPGHELIGLFDVTGDGRADLVSSRSDGSAYVWPGRSDGRFDPAQASFSGSLDSGRFDGEGHQFVTEKKWLRRMGCAVGGCR